VTTPPPPVKAGAGDHARLALVDLSTGEVTDPDRPNGGR